MENSEDGNGAGVCACLCGAVERTELGDHFETWRGKGGRVKEKEQNKHVYIYNLYVKFI